MSVMASEITSLTTFYLTVHSGADQRHTRFYLCRIYAFLDLLPLIKFVDKI